MKFKTTQACAIFALLFSISLVSTAQTDSIVFNNGDVMVGEIKKL
jgi:hypothetical protein